MFSTLGLFKQIPCPDVSKCPYRSCIFSHDLPRTLDGSKDAEPPRKRQKTESDTASSSNLVTTSSSISTEIKKQDIENGHVVPKKAAVQTKPALPKTILKTPSVTPIGTPKGSITITPGSKVLTVKPSSAGTPVKTGNLSSHNAINSVQKPKSEILAPRSLKNPPATLPIRFKLLSLLHQELKRLNSLAAKSAKNTDQGLLLSEQEVITMAIDEENTMAEANPKVYTNVIKNRIGGLKKADGQAWLIERRAKRKLQEAQFTAPNATIIPAKAQPRVKTGLSFKQEIEVITHLTASDKDLTLHGYITSVPKDEEIIKAREGVIAAQGWEKCDRCACRFKVVPADEDDTDDLITGGTCKHHWGRLLSSSKGSNSSATYTCCNKQQGEPGCEEKPTHVFKVTNAARLASVLQFEPTPKNTGSQNLEPLSFDCEMAYTSYGMELIRLTAAAWPSGDPLLDILVRPRGKILDLNTRFSGVSTEQWDAAQPWTSDNLPPMLERSEPKHLRTEAPAPFAARRQTSLSIVPSIQQARKLLFKLIDASTPLVGHALENDLIAIRVVHPTIVDTAILFPHKRGLPLRNKLKFLVLDEIQWVIQDSEAEGHDSLEDALASGELVRHKVALKWATMQRMGWKFLHGKCIDPQLQT